MTRDVFTGRDEELRTGGKKNGIRESQVRNKQRFIKPNWF